MTQAASCARVSCGRGAGGRVGDVVIPVGALLGEVREKGSEDSQLLVAFGAEALLHHLRAEGLRVVLLAEEQTGSRLLAEASGDATLRSLLSDAIILHTPQQRPPAKDALRHIAELAWNAGLEQSRGATSQSPMSPAPSSPASHDAPPSHARTLVIASVSHDNGCQGCSCRREASHISEAPMYEAGLVSWPRLCVSGPLVRENAGNGLEASDRGKPLVCYGAGVYEEGPAEQRQLVASLADIDLSMWGLSPLSVNTENPPFEFPEHFQRCPRSARLVEARYVDERHQQLNLILGRGVSGENVMSVVRAELERELAEEVRGGLCGHMNGDAREDVTTSLDSVFVTIRHDFSVLTPLLADGYRIHHAAKGGTQVVLLKILGRCVEVPEFGTHISRSKVVLYRKRRDVCRGGQVPVQQQQQLQQHDTHTLPSPRYAESVSPHHRQPQGGSQQGEVEEQQEMDDDETDDDHAGDVQAAEEEVFLFRRRKKGTWKLPGGHALMKELADEAAIRELAEETGYACRIQALIGLFERKDVGKKWGCSQLMFTFAAEWVESEQKLDDEESREGRWFPVSVVDKMVGEGDASLDPLVRKVWWSFRRKDRWLRPRPQHLEAGESLLKRYYVCDARVPVSRPSVSDR